jgi:hypothetical protein
VEAGLPNFREQKVLSGYPAAPLPCHDFRLTTAPQAVRISDGGLYGRPFLLSTPQNDKFDIFE